MMKKIVCVGLFLFAGISGVFACKFNKRTHKLTECSEYTNVPMPEKCKKAHSEYNSWLISETKEKFKKQIETTKNELKETSRQVEKDTKKIVDQADSTGNKVKDSFFKFLEKNLFSSDADSELDSDLKEDLDGPEK